MTRTYVVTKQQDRMGREKVVYAGQDVQQAADLCEDLYVPRTEPSGPLETFIHVWEDGEHQYCTRTHPDE